MNRARTHRRPVLAALAVVAMAAVIGLTGCKSSDVNASPVASNLPAGSNASASPSVTAGSPDPSVQPSATSSATAAPTPTPTTTKPPRTLKSGMHGADVLALQKQLTALGYWNGKADGKFGDATQQAIYAVQKAAGIKPRSGTVNSATRKAIANGVRPTAKSSATAGKVIEVDLKRDLLMFTTNGHVDFILNTSTGGGYTYKDQGHTYVATTPKGHFKTNRVIDGPHKSSLGLLIRPRYFYEGDAIHGDGSVPPYPASHGCVRVSNTAINWIWSANMDPIGTKVWIY